MRPWVRKLWPFLKVFLGLALLAAIGRQFARDLQRPDLWHFELHPEWLILTALLYLAGLGCSAVFWYGLLRDVGQRPGFLASLRAYYIGHLGKYLPGKAWALLMRTTLIRGPDVTIGAAAVTTFYEVLATMAAGVLLAAGVFALDGPLLPLNLDAQTIKDFLFLRAPESLARDRTINLLLAVVLFLPTGLPIVPPLFNWLVHHVFSLRTLLARQQEAADVATPTPRIPLEAFLLAMVVCGIGWLFLGLSLWTVLQCILPGTAPLGLAELGRLSAVTAVAYVAGFVFVIVPSGLGVREYFLIWFLMPELLPLAENEAQARSLAVLAVLLLRITWTTAELLIAALLYWLPMKSSWSPPT